MCSSEVSATGNVTSLSRYPAALTPQAHTPVCKPKHQEITAGNLNASVVEDQPEAQSPAFTLPSCVGLQGSHLSSLSLRFLFCKMRAGFSAFSAMRTQGDECTGRVRHRAGTWGERWMPQTLAL